MYLWSIIMYMFMYIISFHLVLNSDDWFLVWLGLEMNMMMFIVLIYKQYNMKSVESCLKYFFVQSLGSGLFMSLFYLEMINVKSASCLVMSYKVGAGPFFFWFPILCMGICWISCFVLFSLQKIIPLMLMNVFMSNIMFMVVFISLMVGIFGSFNQMNLKQLLAYSSVFHLGWIILCNMVDDMSWFIYMLMYMYMLFPLIYFMNYYSMEMLDEISKVKTKNMFILLMLSIGGMPPLLGFFVKWFALGVVLNLSWYMMMFLVLSSVIMFYIYFRLLYDVLLSSYNEMMWISWFYNEKFNDILLDTSSVMGMMLGGMIFMLFNM